MRLGERASLGVDSRGGVRYKSPMRRRRGHAGFTLVELLVVVSIIALLIAIVTPAMSAARRQSKTTACGANLAGVLRGMLLYCDEHRDYVVPSYNMHGVSIGSSNPLDGWAPILDKHGYVYGNDSLRGNPFVCPETLDVAGIAGTQTGGDSDNPRGYMDWPAVLTLSANYAAPLPQRGFPKIIRTAYWINGDNPIGRPLPIEQGVHFTGSVGYGPDENGARLENYRRGLFVVPARTIALADGVYAGMQERTRIGTRDSRIGYRHPGGPGTASAGFADGHVGSIRGDRFPRRLDVLVPIDVAREENLGGGPTVYSDPARFLGGAWTGGNP